MTNRDIRRNRMLRYFIDAAEKIINNEGISSVTIRKVADIAGYNSATLYNYFENLNHLISLTSTKFLRSYTDDLPNYIKKATNSYEKTLLVWECFFHHSYKSPKIYDALFVNNLNNEIPNYIKEFYDIYPEYLEQMPDDIANMLTKDDIYDRSLVLLNECADEGYFDKADLDDINNMTYFIYRGMMAKVITNKYDGDIEDVVSKTMKYLKKVFDAYSKEI